MIRVLGSFMPSSLDGQTIAVELRQWLIERGIEPDEPQIGVRTPADTIRACTNTPVLMEWHRDGAGPDPTLEDAVPSVQRMVVWSNGSSTELRREDGKEIRFLPFDAVLFDNVKVWHRSPLPEANRWFAGIADPKVSA